MDRNKRSWSLCGLLDSWHHVIVLRRLYVLSLNHFRDQHGGRTWFLKTANNVSREIWSKSRKAWRLTLILQVITLGNALNVTIRRDDIDICHTLFTGRNTSKLRPIIVGFKSYRTKKEFYGVRKSLKNQNMSHTFQGSGIVYVNENLTRMRRQLFVKV